MAMTSCKKLCGKHGTESIDFVVMVRLKSGWSVSCFEAAATTNEAPTAAAIVDIAHPNSSAINDFIKPLIKELGLQVAFIKTKKDRLLHIQRVTEERLQGLMSEEIERIEQSGLIGSSKETVELLLRNCLVELQRLNWQAAAEETPINERSLDIRQQLAHSQLKALHDQLVAAQRQFEFQEIQFKAIGELYSSGQVSEVDLRKELAKTEEVKLALESAQQNREKVMLQVPGGTPSLAITPWVVAGSHSGMPPSPR